MNEQVYRNLRAVRGEASAILANIEKVRGPEIRGLVHAEILRQTLMTVVHTILEHTEFSDEDCGKLFEICVDTSARIMEVMAKGFFVESDILKEAVQTATRISESIDSLASDAVTHGKDGRPFGEG